MARGEDALRDLDPGYFALVMATGITSTALFDIGHRSTSLALLVIGVVCFAVLCLLYGARLALHRDAFLADLSAPGRSFAFFTFVAACNVLGARFGLNGHRAVTLGFAAASAPAWLGLSYGLPAQLVLRRREEPALSAVNGTWFLWVVGTQSIAVAAAILELGDGRLVSRAAALTATLMWSVGVVLYLVVATLVLIRLLLVDVKAGDLGPPYWITMGATAITVLAAARILDMASTPVTLATWPVVRGLGVVLWAFGTWLIPLLVGFSVWYTVRARRLRYAPALWSMVFPVSMYATASLGIGRAAHLPLFREIGHGVAWVGVAVWAAVFALLLASLLAAPAARICGKVQVSRRRVA